MLIWDVPYYIFPIIALFCNILVVSGNSINYIKSGTLNLKLLVPYLAGSIPFAFLGASISIEKEMFEILLFFILIVAGIFLFIESKSFNNDEIKINKIPKILSIIIGSVIGFTSGVIGIGGGIYLVPIIIMFGLGSEKEAAAAGAMLIWLNSLIGVAARTRAGSFDLDFILPLSIAVIIGGFIGSYLGAVRFSASKIQRVMGSVIIFAIVILLKGLL